MKREELQAIEIAGLNEIIKIQKDKIDTIKYRLAKLSIFMDDCDCDSDRELVSEYIKDVVRHMGCVLG